SFGRSSIRLLAKTDRESLMVAICSCATIVLFPAAFLETTIANAFTIIAALPFVTAAIAWVWMRERPSGATMIASALALVGITIMLNPTTGGPHIGDLLAILGTISQGLMTVLIRRNPHVQMLPMAWVAVILSVIVAYPLASQIWELSARDYLVAAGFGLGPMTLGMMLYVLGSAFIPAT